MPATACAPALSAEEGLFGPHSIVWKIDRELAVLVGSGSRALLMQVAHPTVAAAVAQHSRFQTDPLGRLFGTLNAIYGFAFADADRATRIAASIGRIHAGVRGTTPDGTDYSALDPHLLLWVYATLIDSSLLAYETFVGPLSIAERERYYAELRRAGPLWGIRVDEFPDCVGDLRTWMANLITSGEVHVTAQARDLSHCILHPRLWWLPKQAGLPVELITAWLLPAELRAGFGFAWGPRREALMRTIAATSRTIVPRLPGPVRELPLARAAHRRATAVAFKPHANTA